MSAHNAERFLDEMGLVSPWMNVAGFLGYLPPAHLEFGAEMGAFVPPMLTRQARNVAENRALLPYSGGFLLHNASPNPGITAALRQYAKRWSNLKLPVWLHLFAENEEEAAQMSALADELENVLAVQIEVPLRMANKARLAIWNAARGEKPLLAVLPLDEVQRDLVSGCAALGLSGLVLAAPRGRMRKNESWVNGRLYGPALLPQMVLALERYRKMGLPLIAGGGVYSLEEGDMLLKAGAVALQVDAALWI